VLNSLFLRLFSLKILELLQSYLWRRFITGEPSNVLNKIFQTMYSKVSKTGDYYLNLEYVKMNRLEKPDKLD